MSATADLRFDVRCTLFEADATPCRGLSPSRWIDSHCLAYPSLTTLQPKNSRRKKLNDYIPFNVIALCLGMSVLMATMTSAQQKSAQQPTAQQKRAKLEEIAQYLGL